jgi:hypothetical protein
MEDVACIIGLDFDFYCQKHLGHTWNIKSESNKNH